MKRAPLSLMLMLGGCAVGPDFHQPAAPIQRAYTPLPITAMAAPEGVAGGRQQLRDGAPARDWWRLFGSPQLDALVERALATNSDLAAARAALDQAKESWRAQRGVLFPTVDAGAGSSRNKSSQYLSAVPGDNSYTYQAAEKGASLCRGEVIQDPRLDIEDMECAAAITGAKGCFPM